MRDDMLTELEKVINERRRIYLLRHGEVSYFDPVSYTHLTLPPIYSV